MVKQTLVDSDLSSELKFFSPKYKKTNFQIHEERGFFRPSQIVRETKRQVQHQE